MSDILKKAKEKEREAKEERQKKPFIEPDQQEAAPEPVKPVKEVVTPEVKADDEVEKPKIEQQPEVREQKEEEAKPSEVRISPVVMKGTKVVSSEESLKLYEALMSLMKEILKEDINHESIDVKQITALIEKIIEQLSLNNEKLLELALIKDSKDVNYIFCHSINVCIYSIAIGLGLGYEKSKLTELGISALLHDAGMSCYLPVVNRSTKLTTREYNEIKNHSINGSAFLEKIKNLNRIASYVAHQHHERIDSSGYPRGLKGESINEYAKIVGIVDVFEAMLHQRLYRNEFLPLEALREILANKNSFQYRLIKILIEKIGIFPIGSLVELNTKEIAQVVKLNYAVPLRPVVKIISGVDGEEPKETKTLDLTTQPTICIKKGLRKSELGKLHTVR